MVALDFSADYELLHVLGQGGEGTVYLVCEKKSGRKRILKIFHTPIQGTSADGLRTYTAKIQENDVGLPAISLLGDEHQVNGLHYDYLPLYEVHWRVLASWEKVGQSLFGAYCRIQHYLISHSGIGLSDTDIGHFLLSQSGQFYFVDYGFAIKPIQHSHYLDQGRLGYGFSMLLLGIHHKNLKLEILPTPAYDYQTPCRYSFSQQLDELIVERAWVREIVTEVRSQPASIFLNADFYQYWASRLPQRAPLPRLLTATSKLLAKSRVFTSRSLFRQRLPG
jgi:hypothetical protein